jgi:hypothetical protein
MTVLADAWKVIEPTATTIRNSMAFFTHSCSMARAVTITIDLLRPALIFPPFFSSIFPILNNNHILHLQYWCVPQSKKIQEH